MAITKSTLLVIGLVGFVAVFGLGLFMGLVSAFAAALLVLGWAVILYFDLFGQTGPSRFIGLGIVLALIFGISLVGTAAGISISAPSAGSFRLPGLGDAWNAFINPQQYAEQKFVEKGERDVQAAASALEIGKITIAGASGLQGDTVMPGQNFSIVFQIVNKGNKPALLQQLGVNMESKAGDAGFLIADFKGERLGSTYAHTENVSRLIFPGPGNVQSFDIVAPACGSNQTYKFGAFLNYRYDVSALLGVDLINPDYYQQLSAQQKLKFADPATNACLGIKEGEVCVRDGISTSGAGPFKLTIRTTQQQPIQTQDLAILPTGEKMYLNQSTEIWVGLVNEQKGGALVFDINVTIPDIFVLDPGKRAACQLVHTPTASNPNLYKPRPIVDAQRSKTFVLIPAERKEPEFWKCGFLIDPGRIKSITRTSTTFITASVDYEYHINEEKTVKVATVAGQETCEQKQARLAQAQKNVFTMGLPTNKKDALGNLTEKICLCSSYITANTEVPKECSSISINLPACTAGPNNTITFKEILDHAKANYPNQACATQQDKIKFKNTVGLDKIAASGAGSLALNVLKGGNDIKDQSFTLQPGTIYQLKPVYWTSWPWGNGVDIQITDVRADDKECNQPINAACEAASTNSTTCASKNCQSVERWITSQQASERPGSVSLINQTVNKQISNLTAGGKNREEVLSDAPYIKKVLDALAGEANTSEAFVCQPPYALYNLSRGGECKIDVGGGNFKSAGFACEVKGADLTLRWCGSATLYGRVSDFCLAPCTINMPLTKPKAGKDLLSESSYPEGACIYPSYRTTDWAGITIAANFTPGLAPQYINGGRQEASDNPASMVCICPKNDGTNTYRPVPVDYNSTTKTLACRSPCDTTKKWTVQDDGTLKPAAQQQPPQQTPSP